MYQTCLGIRGQALLLSQEGICDCKVGRAPKKQTLWTRLRAKAWSGGGKVRSMPGSFLTMEQSRLRVGVEGGRGSLDGTMAKREDERSS